jgi:hypothetical protein
MPFIKLVSYLTVLCNLLVYNLKNTDLWSSLPNVLGETRYSMISAERPLSYNRMTCIEIITDRRIPSCWKSWNSEINVAEAICKTIQKPNQNKYTNDDQFNRLITFRRIHDEVLNYTIVNASDCLSKRKESRRENLRIPKTHSRRLEHQQINNSKNQSLQLPNTVKCPKAES